MKTALIMHGPQGAGKNMFFEAVMAIYGSYGRVVDQSSIEDKFNDWASRKLFLIAGPCVVESETLQFEVAGRLKEMTTALRLLSVSAFRSRRINSCSDRLGSMSKLSPISGGFSSKLPVK